MVQLRQVISEQEKEQAIEALPTASRLYYYANLYRQKITNEQEIEQINATELLDYELDQMIRNGEIIIININAKMRLGKSTLAMAIAKNKIVNLLKKYKYQNKEYQFGLKPNQRRNKRRLHTKQTNTTRQRRHNKYDNKRLHSQKTTSQHDTKKLEMGLAKRPLGTKTTK